MTNNDRIAAIDPARTAYLGAWSAAVCVNPNGEESLWLVSPNTDRDAGCACPDCAPHEQLTHYTMRNTEARERTP